MDEQRARVEAPCRTTPTGPGGRVRRGLGGRSASASRGRPGGWGSLSQPRSTCETFSTASARASAAGSVPDRRPRLRAGPPRAGPPRRARRARARPDDDRRGHLRQRGTADGGPAVAADRPRHHAGHDVPVAAHRGRAGDPGAGGVAPEHGGRRVDLAQPRADLLQRRRDGADGRGRGADERAVPEPERRAADLRPRRRRGGERLGHRRGAPGPDLRAEPRPERPRVDQPERGLGAAADHVRRGAAVDGHQLGARHARRGDGRRDRGGERRAP